MDDKQVYILSVIYLVWEDVLCLSLDLYKHEDTSCGQCYDENSPCGVCHFVLLRNLTTIWL